jgi:hypothetical protein
MSQVRPEVTKNGPRFGPPHPWQYQEQAHIHSHAMCVVAAAAAIAIGVSGCAWGHTESPNTHTK